MMLLMLVIAVSMPPAHQPRHAPINGSVTERAAIMQKYRLSAKKGKVQRMHIGQALVKRRSTVAEEGHDWRDHPEWLNDLNRENFD